VETRVGQEAAAVGALFRDVSSFPDPNRTEIQADLRQYVRQVIDVAWLLGLLIYLLGALDNPFRGEISVGPEAFEIMYTRRVMVGK
jgi:hypothetical protein